MKKLMIALVGLVLAGAGCLPIANKTIDGKWQLTFDLPEGWAMVVPYEVANTGDARPTSEDVRRSDAEVYLQSTRTPICLAEKCAEGSVKEGTQIKAVVLDSRRKLDMAELTDLGKGFYMKAGTPNMYYYKTDKATYQFSVTGNGESAKPVILSAKEVTHFTDIPSIEVQTQ